MAPVAPLTKVIAAGPLLTSGQQLHSSQRRPHPSPHRRRSQLKLSFIGLIPALTSPSNRRAAAIQSPSRSHLIAEPQPSNCSNHCGQAMPNPAICLYSYQRGLKLVVKRLEKSRILPLLGWKKYFGDRALPDSFSDGMDNF